MPRDHLSLLGFPRCTFIRTAFGTVNHGSEENSEIFHLVGLSTCILIVAEMKKPNDCDLGNWGTNAWPRLARLRDFMHDSNFIRIKRSRKF